MIQKLNWQHNISFEQMCNNVSSRVDEPSNSEYERYVGLEHLDTLEPKITRYGSTQNIKSSMTLFKRGQILFGRRNWYLRRVAVADFDGICSADIYALEAKGDKITHGFLPIFMHSKQFFDETMKYSAGSMSTRVKWSHLSKIKFSIPPPRRQRKIVSLITRVDESITKTQLLLGKLKIYKNSKMEELLTRGIGHSKFKKVKWLFGKTIEIPEEWEMPKFDKVVKTNPLTTIEDEIVSYIPMNAVDTDKAHFNYTVKRKLSDFSNLPKFQENDVLFASITPSTENGKTCIVENFPKKGLASSELTVLRVTPKVFPRYLYY